jgi:hypothetical protein
VLISERPVNQGGEPGHDDYGLPRVDIEIPDDARELYRDVQAYHRELRAIRRQQRNRRLAAPLRRSGLVLPLAAGFLVLALISGMVLTVFSANPYFTGMGGHRTSKSPAVSHGAKAAPGNTPRSAPASALGSSSAASSAPATASSTPGPGQTQPVAAPSRLPGKTISVAGKSLALRSLTRIALAIVPLHCGCQAAVQQLIAQARAARVTVYLVGPHDSKIELARLAAVSGPDAVLAIDARDVLSKAYQPNGLTVLLVDAHHSVKVASGLALGLNLEQRLQQLRSGG